MFWVILIILRIYFFNDILLIIIIVTFFQRWLRLAFGREISIWIIFFIEYSPNPYLPLPFNFILLYIPFFFPFSHHVSFHCLSGLFDIEFSSNVILHLFYSGKECN